MKTDYLNKQHIYDYFAMMNRSGIRWILIKNIGHELPYRLKDGKDIDIMVDIHDKARFTEVMAQGGFLNRIPPLGIANGYRFGYQLPEYQFWQKASIKQKFYVDACFRLMCKSLTPHYWIPLDETINQNAWGNKVWDAELQCFRMGDKELLVYLLVRCVFDKHDFPTVYREEINQLKNLLDKKEVRDMLQTVFYKCTDMIIRMVMDEQYEHIYQAYIQYEDY